MLVCVWRLTRVRRCHFWDCSAHANTYVFGLLTGELGSKRLILTQEQALYEVRPRQLQAWEPGRQAPALLPLARPEGGDNEEDHPVKNGAAVLGGETGFHGRH